MSLKEGDFAQAVYEFPGESPSDLRLKVKDVVKVTEVIDGNWAKGQRAHPSGEGVFPLAFVERLHFPSLRTGQKIFLVVQDFPADQIGDLELNKGDVIVGTEAIDDSWWNGKNGPLKGMFPVSFVVELEQNDGIRSRSASYRSNSLKSRANSLLSSKTGSFGNAKLDNPVIAQALVNVTPQLDGELAFQMGDLIEITEFVDIDWMYGRCRDREGLVSAVCVELLEDVDSEPTPDLSKVDNHHTRIDNQIESKSKTEPCYPNANLGHRENSNVKEQDGYRSHSGTGGSYTSENTRSHDAEITPYARVVYSFTAQYTSELSLKENQIVSLIQHLNTDWTEGEVDGKRGMFPTSFIEIIVDCPYNFDCDTNVSDEYESPSQLSKDSTLDNYRMPSAQPAMKSSEPELNNNLKNNNNIPKSGKTLEKQKRVEEEDIKSACGTGIKAEISDVLIVSEGHEIGLVLFSFQAQVDGDVSVSEGDTVEVVKKVDGNWIQVQVESGKRGLVPSNHIEIIGLWPKEENKEAEAKKAPAAVIDSKITTSVSDTKRMSSSTTNSVISQSLGRQGLALTATVPTAQPESSSPLSLPSSSPKAKNVTSLPKQKPLIAPKPAIAPKPPVIKQPFSKPAAFYTAKPFSSSLSSGTRHVNSSKAQKEILPSLDSLIEGEISKAKSRSSSENSTASLDSIKSTSITGPCSEPQSSHPGLSTQPLIPLPSNTTTPGTVEISEFDPIKIPSKPNERPKLINSVSLPYNSDPVPHPSSSSKSTRRASSSNVTIKQPPVLKPPDRVTKPSHSTTITTSNINAGCVNPAFEQEVDEGILIPSDKIAPPARPPPRVAPPCPVRPTPQVSSSSPATQSTSSITSTTSRLSSKPKAPPPRPTGPRLASAPSRIPLVPLKVTPQDGTEAKPVPLRKAPKPPVSAEVSTGEPAVSLDSATLPANSNKENVQGLRRDSSTQPLRRPPPRPTAFPSLPKGPVPDLMKFSPEKTTEAPEEEEEELDEEKKDLVFDLKKRIAETMTDIKVRLLRRHRN